MCKNIEKVEDKVVFFRQVSNIRDLGEEGKVAAIN